MSLQLKFHLTAAFDFPRLLPVDLYRRYQAGVTSPRPAERDPVPAALGRCAGSSGSSPSSSSGGTSGGNLPNCDWPITLINQVRRPGWSNKRRIEPLTMKIVCAKDCGNAPRKEQLRDMTSGEPTELRIHNIITHGNTAAANFTLTLNDGTQVEYCDVYVFGSSGKRATIKEVKSYRIPLTQ